MTLNEKSTFLWPFFIFWIKLQKLQKQKLAHHTTWTDNKLYDIDYRQQMSLTDSRLQSWSWSITINIIQARWYLSDEWSKSWHSNWYFSSDILLEMFTEECSIKPQCYRDVAGVAWSLDNISQFKIQTCVFEGFHQPISF